MSKELSKNISFNRYPDEIKVGCINVCSSALLSEHSVSDEAGLNI